MLLALLVIFLLNPLCLYSQGETAGISGQVTDAAGVGLSNAEIEIVNQETGLRRVTRTASGGRYLVDFIPPGVYSIKVASTDYLPEDHLTTLHVATHMEVDFTLLRMYEMQGEVIEADRPRETIIEPGVSGIADAEEINRLHYKRREYQNLAVLTPGVRRGSIAGVNVFDLDVVSISGRDASSVFFAVDGLDNNDFSAGLPAMEYPQESIREYRVGTHRGRADFGGSAGGFINVLTKSGTNTLSGSFFTYLKNEGMMARDHFMKSYGAVNPDLATTQFGTSIGGPIVQDQTHFFASYEGTRGEDEFLTVNTGGAFPDEERSYARPVTEDMFFIKLDHNLSLGKKLTLRYNQHNSMMKLLDTGGMTAIGSSRREDLDRYMVSGSYDWHLLQKLNTRFTGYYGHFRRLSVARNPGAPVLSFPSAVNGSSFSAPFDHTAEKIGVGGAVSFAGPGSASRHNIKAGFDYQRVNTTFMNDRLTNGAFVYQVDDPSAAPLFFRITMGDSSADMNRDVFSLYIDDHYTVNRRINLFLGLRYDVEKGMLKDYHDAPAFRFIRENYQALQSDLSRYFPELGLSDGYRTTESDLNNVAPRMGATYDLTGRGSVILRGGWGIYYDTTYDLFVRAVALQNSERPFLNYLVVRPGFSPDSIPDLGHLYDPSGDSADIAYLSPQLSTPYTHQSSIGVSLPFTEDLSLELDYVNSIGRNELKLRNINFKQDGTRLLSDQHGNITVLESIGISRYDALLLQLRNRFGKHLTAHIGYTLSRTKGTQDGYNTRAQDDLRPLAAVEFGPTRHDATHNLSMSVLTDILNMFEINSFITIESPRPYTIKTGGDENGDGFRNDMPEGVHRNSERGDWTFQWDLRISKFFEIGKYGRSELLLDILNVTNTVNFGNFYFDSQSSPSFGQPRKIFTLPRHVQIGLRHNF